MQKGDIFTDSPKLWGHVVQLQVNVLEQLLEIHCSANSTESPSNYDHSERSRMVNWLF